VGLIAYLLGAATAGRSTVDTGQSVKAYASGTALHVDALQAGLTGPRVADVEDAFSAANVDSNGFSATSRLTENSVLVQPDPADHDPATPFVGKNASARGAGLELGVGSNVPTAAGDVINLTRSGATASPDSSESNDLGPVPGAPVVYASLLHSDALARWDAATCLTTASAPIAYGRGYAADVELVDAGTANPDGSLGSPVVASNDPTPDRNVSQTISYAYAIANGTAGHYGLVSEIHETYAPVEIGQDPITGGAIEIEVLGEWYLRTVADGVHQATMTYGVTDADPASPTFGQPIDPTDTVIRVSAGGTEVIALSLNDVFASPGQEIPLGPLGSIMLGEDVRAISAAGGLADPASTPTLLADGTRAAGALDVVRADVLDEPEGGS
jgi:hypothetical protein